MAGWLPDFWRELRQRRVVRVAEARRRGKAEDALRILLRATYWSNDRLDERRSPIFAHAYEKFLRAELLRELGRHADAIRWYAVAGEWPLELDYLAPSHLRRAELYERMGDRNNARREYASFLKLWQQADPEVMPLVTRARDRLAKLSGEPAAR